MFEKIIEKTNILQKFLVINVKYIAKINDLILIYNYCLFRIFINYKFTNIYH
jgi:hypothetical protein